MIKEVMEAYEYRLVDYRFFPESFGNGFAVFDKEHDFEIKMMLDRGEMRIDVRPKRGIASIKQYRMIDVLIAVKNAGHDIYQKKNDTDEELVNWLKINLGLIFQLKTRMRFFIFREPEIR